MPELARGLRLEITDRDKYREFVEENAHDPAVLIESWGPNSVPDAMYIDKFNHDEQPYYRLINEHVNGITTTVYINASLIEKAIESDILSKDSYDVEFVKNNR